jgi:hypothetical protein
MILLVTNVYGPHCSLQNSFLSSHDALLERWVQYLFQVKQFCKSSICFMVASMHIDINCNFLLAILIQHKYIYFLLQYLGIKKYMGPKNNRPKAVTPIVIAQGRPWVCTMKSSINKSNYKEKLQKYIATVP